MKFVLAFRRSYSPGKQEHQKTAVLMHLTGRALQSRVALKSAISETLLRFRPGARRVHPTDALRTLLRRVLPPALSP